jgi:hypothetical protein
MNGSGKKQKVGRNDPCLCGSGKKFKKCHGQGSSTPSAIQTEQLPEVVKQILERQKAAELQREKQQGFGKPIISTFCDGQRFVAVKDKIFHSPKWKTFHDFLHYYIKILLGGEWAEQELKKPEAERHPLLNWYEITARFQNQFIKEPGKINIAPMTGAVTAYLGLAYSLYLVAHNVTVQQILLKRLIKKDQFYGAAYETLVAGVLVRAGFDIEFEEETDSKISHCELTATCKKTGKKFSVEAKKRELGKTSAYVGHQLYAALKKNAAHARIIFIEVNMPDDCDDIKAKQTLEQAVSGIKLKEPSLTIDGSPAPPAYVLVTNNPHEYNMNNRSQSSAIATGFKIPEFGYGVSFRTLREAISARDKHIEMHILMKSLADHHQIPATFDGEIPELAYGKTEPRLIIGKKYSVPDESGKEVVGELQHAVVLEKDKVASGVCKLADGRNVIVTFPLTNDELVAYQKYPDTFFGTHKPHAKGINDPLELYDFLLDYYGQTPKEVLLGHLTNSANLEALKNLPQMDLAQIYCEGMVYQMMQTSKKSQLQQ